MTPALYIEFHVPRDEPTWDAVPELYGDTGKEQWRPDLAAVCMRFEVEWLEHDGAGGVFARLVGAEEDLYLSDEDLPVWKAVAE